MGMILYDMALSPNAKRARIGLGETGAPFEKREVNLLAGEQKTPEYRCVHPLGRIPALDDDGVVVWESGAILLYLADKFPEVGLMPRPLAERGQVYQWLTFGETNIHAYMGPMGFQMLRRAPEARDQGILDRGRKRMPEVLAVLDRQLTGKRYLVGDFSIADCACAPWLDITPALGIELTPYPNVERWLARMRDRPSWTA
jgi:glutathione S-transferase